MCEFFADSLVTGFLQSSFMGQAIVAVQIAGSLVMFSAILGKMLRVWRLPAVTRRMAHDVMDSGTVLGYYLSRRPNAHSPIEEIYTATCDRLVKLIDPAARAALISRSASSVDVALTKREIELVDGLCEHTLEEEIIKLDKGMPLISTVVAAAPMLGLLGTVWGVLDAFADMGAAGSATIATMAPAISSALVTTVVGLLVAIPGLCLFNAIQTRIRKLTNDIEGFCDDLMGRIALEYGREG